MTKDTRPRSRQTQGRGWQRPWVVKQDLRHDEAIDLPAPHVLSGEMLQLTLHTSDVIQWLEMFEYTGLVVNPDLIKDLFLAVTQFALQKTLALPAEQMPKTREASIRLANKLLPEAIRHDAVPNMYFVPRLTETHRLMDVEGEGDIPTKEEAASLLKPADEKVFIFWVRPRYTVVPRPAQLPNRSNGA